MAQTGYTALQLYHSSTHAAEPMATNLLEGELAVNVTDRKVFTKNASGVVVSVGGGASGGGPDQVFYENDTAVANDYTITTGRNAMTAGPVTINTGVTVTVPTGSTWSII